MTMSCITLFAQEAAMPTKQLTHVAGHEVCTQWWVEPKAEHTALRRSWVVVTEENGKRSLRACWNIADELSEHAALTSDSEGSGTIQLLR